MTINIHRELRLGWSIQCNLGISSLSISCKLEIWGTRNRSPPSVNSESNLLTRFAKTKVASVAR
jgi:hypothetical protein